MVFEVLQEASHVVLIIGGDQRKGDGEITDWVGGQQQDAVAQVQFVDAQGAGEILDGPVPVAGHVGLPDFPVKAVVKEAVR